MWLSVKVLITYAIIISILPSLEYITPDSKLWKIIISLHTLGVFIICWLLIDVLIWVWS